MLAHERILQSLIAHVAETEPKFISRLYATFGDPMQTPRQEHDYTDTDTYAARLIAGVARLGVGSADSDVTSPKGRKSHGQQSNSTPVVAVSPAPPTAFRVTSRTGVWRVTKDGRFYGDFLARTQADKAIATAIQAISRGGGSTVVL